MSFGDLSAVFVVTERCEVILFLSSCWELLKETQAPFKSVRVQSPAILKLFVQVSQDHVGFGLPVDQL